MAPSHRSSRNFRFDERGGFRLICLLPADLAAIPDFQSGAMENWGLTTYRETALLYDPDKSSASDKLAVTKVIAHELAHQVADVPSFQIDEYGGRSTYVSETGVPFSGLETW